MKYLISSLALAAAASAASCSTKGTMTISSPSQVTELSSCTTFTGSVEISKKFNGDVSISGLRKISGDFISSAPKMSSLTASDLQSIGGTWEMITPSNLNTLAMDQLSSVKGINWANWPPNLSTFSFATGITDIDTISISTTSLSTLDGINPMTPTNVQISSNALLQNITMQVTSIKGQMNIQGNSEDLESSNSVAVTLPKLKSAHILSFTEVGSVSLPALTMTSGTVTMRNSYLESISVPELTKAGGISISNNTALKKVSLPKLKTDSGAFLISDNDKLTGALSFPQLTIIEGAPIVTGSFSSLSMPKLSHVTGTFTITSNKDIDSTCKTFGKDRIDGGLKCHGKVPKVKQPKPSNNNHHGGNNGGNNGGNGGGNGGGNSAAGHFQVSVGLLLSGVAAAVVVLL